MNDLKDIIENTTNWILSHLANSNTFKCQLFDILINEDNLTENECISVVSEIEKNLNSHGCKCYRNHNDIQFTVEK
ncbi:MAG: hypothetical protein ACRCX2_28645 [Paraclostridium sp.]